MGEKDRLLPISVLGLCLLSAFLGGAVKGAEFVMASEASGAEASGTVISASEPSEAYDLGERFLKTDGKVLRNHAGKGEAVTLRGTNIGGWQMKSRGWLLFRKRIIT